MTSLIYQPLTTEQLTHIVACNLADHGTYQSRIATGGLFNTTYQLTFADASRFILRVGPVQRHLLLPFEHNLMTGEVIADAHLTAAGIPCPQVTVCDRKRTVIDRDYMLWPALPGKILGDLSLTDQQRPVLYHQLGTYLRRMHDITMPYFGRAGSTACGCPRFATWGGFLISEFDIAVDLLLAHDLLTSSEGNQLKQLFENARPLFDQIRRPALVHADLWDANILAASDGSHITGIIDADRAMYGDPEFDFSGGWQLAPAFFEGYGKPLAATPAARRRRLFYQLFYRTLDTPGLFIEFQKSSAIP
ncbi:phosphotransferase family protein [Lacticaseibacillus jixiensis]|uniref:phosphotransferase family protein n=1 Tax=Lacticaseibacillus jixiensis TaxID=3231926 RepID=UPI0036F3B7F3